MTPSKKFERFQCPGCAGDMDFDPASGKLKCRYCGTTADVPASLTKTLAAHPIEQALTTASMGEQALEVSCNGCGSVVTFQPPEVAGVCPFCAASIVAQPKAADPLIAPDGVLAAKIPVDKARAEVRQWIQTRWFAPNALKRMASQEGVNGVYLPFWEYAADTFSRYIGERGVHYWETEVYEEDDGQGRRVQRTRQVQRTRWYPASGAIARHFDDVLIPASKSIPERRLMALEPWDLEALVEYEPAYLSGFKAQRYQVDVPGGMERAKAVMAGVIEGDVRGDIGGDEQRIHQVDTQYSNVTFMHLLLPVWIGAYRFQGKVYQVVVNARTGEVQGERPYSAWKILLLIAAIIVIIAIVAMLANSK